VIFVYLSGFTAATYTGAQIIAPRDGIARPSVSVTPHRASSALTKVPTVGASRYLHLWPSAVMTLARQTASPSSIYERIYFRIWSGSSHT